MRTDRDYSSSGESGSEGSLGRSQEDPGSFVLQKRSSDKPSGHPEGNGMLASAPMVSRHMATEKPTMSTPGINIGMEYWNGPMVSAGHEALKPQYVIASSAGTMPYNGPGSEGKGSGVMWSQPVQDDREQKREKRKQANRESARRSRMRKQFEYEELAEKVASLTAENDSLKLEVNRLGDLYQKLSNEKSTLLERVHKVQS